jgi:antitoxin CptB
MQEEDIKKFLDNIPKLQWACRRGMLELDVLLGNFLNEAYPHLAKEEKILFINLLNLSDPELIAYLMGQEKPADEGLAKITEKIRHHARSRF